NIKRPSTAANRYSLARATLLRIVLIKACVPRMLRNAPRRGRDRRAELHRHHDLAEVFVGFHVLEGRADISELVDLVDRQLQLAAFHCAPDVLADLIEDLAHLLDRPGAEGDADIVDAARRVQVEIEIAMRAAEAADIDDAALDFRRLQVLVGDGAGD